MAQAISYLLQRGAGERERVNSSQSNSNDSSWENFVDGHWCMDIRCEQCGISEADVQQIEAEIRALMGIRRDSSSTWSPILGRHGFAAANETAFASGEELQKLVRLALQKHETLRVRRFGEPLGVVQQIC